MKVVDDVIQKVDQLNKQLPAGVQMQVIKESATYIKKSVESLEEHLVLGSLLASFIVWIFIRDWRTVLISAIAIPTSIVTTFTIMRMLDYTLNSMTLLALTLAVGIVIDDAIIVLENIYRHIEKEDEEPMKAAVTATREISLAVIATTLSLVIIFVPIAFITGYAKRYLNQFGWTMSVSIIVSMLVAFTLTPTLSARPQRRSTREEPRIKGGADGAQVTLLEKGYLGMLSWALAHRWAIILVCAGVFLSTFPLYQNIGRDWMPQEDQSELGLSLEMPEGSSLEATERLTLELAKKIEKVPGVSLVVPSSSSFLERVAQGNITILLDPPNKRGSLEVSPSRFERSPASTPTRARGCASLTCWAGATHSPLSGARCSAPISPSWLPYRGS